LGDEFLGFHSIPLFSDTQVLTIKITVMDEDNRLNGVPSVWEEGGAFEMWIDGTRLSRFFVGSRVVFRRAVDCRRL
jgi:hypothetical protein